MIYDFVIVGGGIGGLYTAYKLHLQFPKKTILVLEKSNYLGGRVFTYRDKYMTVEAGAGRFSDKHTKLLKLIHDLGLDSKIVHITGSLGYAPADGTNSIYNSFADTPVVAKSLMRKTVNSIRQYSSIHGNPLPLLESMGMTALDASLGSSNVPISGLIAKVVLTSKGELTEKLQNISFIDYAKQVLKNDSEVQLIVDAFGYYSELVIMNAHDAIQLMDLLGPSNRFYTMNGGLDQIIEKLVLRLDNKYVKILKNKTVSDIVLDVDEKTNDMFFEIFISENVRRVVARVCICALPLWALKKLTISRHFAPLLKNVLCAPLCRIYSKFAVDADGDVWFKNMPKLTTNNNLRMIIPISEKEGVIMISYTDNKFAKYWKRVYDKYGVDGVDSRIAKLIKESTGMDIPKPLKTKVCYWDCGVGYWGLGANSAVVSQSILKPFCDFSFYVCGEHFSEKFQQWMEGALETSEKVVLDIVAKM
jgi:monoamine oxidase